MRINHGDAVSLEMIARKVYQCDRGGMGGYIDADHFESSPFDAALIALAPLWKNMDFHSVGDFLYKWEYEFRQESSNEQSVRNYIQELDALVSSAMN